ncbi:MAG TPA: TonB-dependent receptor [Gammaproteobacteria bacterium]|nr:TonB-dependent receptor [Gammaproteobacteria bacterium]
MTTTRRRVSARASSNRVSLEPKKLARAVAAALAMQAIGFQVANAQPAPQTGQQPEEVLVTGSRIVRRDYDANSPLQTVDKSAFENQSSISLETALNDLPQFVPAAQGMTQLQDQSQLTDNFPTQTSGASTISLRGLGPNRNLVLIDGYRAVPVNSTMAVDLNSIPGAAVERVEVITGGASSVYGADAVAGVVNFILKKNFEGVDIDVQTGSMQNGKGPESRASVLFGVNSSDGRGNIMLGLERAKREEIHADDTDFYRHALRDGTVEGTELIYTGPYWQIETANPPTPQAIDAIFSRAGAAGVVLRDPLAPRGISGRVYWNDDGSVYTGGESFNGVSPGGAGPNHPNATAGTYRYNGPTYTSRSDADIPGDYPFRKIDAEGQISQELLQYEANIPLDRGSVFGRAEYDLTEGITAYAQVLSVQSQTRRLFTESPAVAGWGMTAPHGNTLYAPSVVSLGADGLPGTADPGENMGTRLEYLPGGRFGLNCPATGGCTESQAWPVSPELTNLLNSRQDPNADFSFNFGLDFSAFGAPGSAFRSIFSETRTNQFSFGLRGAIEGIDGTWDVIVSEGKAKLDVRLEGYASLERTRTLFTRSPNWGTGFFAQGNSGTPGGGFSGGVATCTSGMPVFRNHGVISQDCLDAIFVTLNHQSQMDQKFFEGNLQGHLVNMPAGEARFSAGVHSRENSYYYIFDPLQTQESFNDNPMGFPANNTRGQTGVDEVYGEMLLPLLKGKTGAQHLNLELGYRYSDYDLQGGVDTSKALIDWGITPTLRFRGGKQLATRAPNIAELFQADTQSWYVSGTGDPCGLNSNAKYGANATANPAGFAQARAICGARMGTAGAATFYTGTQPNGTFWTPFVNATGNPSVNPEDAETWTAGFVWSPNSGHEKLDGLNLTVDYYDIELTGMISVEPAEVVYEACLSQASNPTGDVNSPACLRVNRNPANGGAAPTTVSYINAAFAKVSGVDVTADWRTDLVGGNFGVNFMISSLLDEKTQATSASKVIDWKGSLGPDPGTSLNNGAYDYRTFTTVNYGRDKWNTALRWRHLPTALDATQVVVATSTQTGAQESYDIFDLSGAWNINGKTTLRFGVDNLFDAPAVWTGGRTAQDPSPSTGSGTTEAGFYDILGRTFYVGLKASF